MAKSKVKSKTRSRKPKTTPQDGISLVTLMSTLGGFLLGYLGGEIGFAVRPHPVHWASGLLVAILGYILGEVIYRRFGDVI